VSIKHANLHGSLVSVAQVATFITLLEWSHHCNSVAVRRVWQTFVYRSGYRVIFLAAPANESKNSFEVDLIRTMKVLQVKAPTAPSSDQFECACVCTFH
jgi:hypothetical protein